MYEFHKWINARMYSTIIIGGTYKTVLSFFEPFEKIVDTLIDEFDSIEKAKPVIVVSATVCDEFVSRYLLENDIPNVVIGSE